MAARGRRRIGARLLASLGALGAAGAIAGLGTFASFTSTTSASRSVTSGKVTIALGTTGTSANRLTVNASEIVPGDVISRAVDLTSTSSDALASVTVTTTATVSSLLNTDTTDGLKMTIQRCSVAWTETVITAPTAVYTYACTGSSSYVLGAPGAAGGVPVIRTTAALAGLAALSSGASVDRLVVSLLLPVTAPGTMQGLTSTIQWVFTGTQRAAAAR